MSGLSLRAGGRGFPPATTNVSSGYFETKRKQTKTRLWMKTRNVEQCHLLSKARDFTTCLFHPHSFVVGVFCLCIWHPENEKQRLITKENWNPSSVLALLQGKVTIYWTNNSSGLVSSGRRGGLMVNELDSGSSGPGSSPGRGHCVVLLGKTLNSHSASLHPGE